MFSKFFVIFLRSADEVHAALIFDEFSSDDECITEGEKPALPSVADVEPIEPNITLREILHNLSSVITDSETCKFNISRNHIWEGAKRALNRKSFNPQNKLSVKFTDDMGISQGAVDLGGPAREFFTLVTERLVNSQLFVGEATSKFLSLNAKCLEEREYYLAGQVFAMSLVHGGPTLKCLSDLCYDCIVKGVQNVNASPTDASDYDLRISLDKLLNAPNITVAEQVISDAKLDLVFDMAGTFQVIKSTSDIVNLVQKTVNWYVLGRAQPAYDSFKEGLRTLGVLGAVLQYPNVMREAFCFKPETLNVTDFDSIFSITRACEGSNRREVENLVLSHWQDLIQDCEEESAAISLSDILFFVSGCKQLPPQGLSCQILFLHEPEETSATLSRFPKASTCSCTLYLPVVHKTYHDFKGAMGYAIQNSRGFGMA